MTKPLATGLDYVDLLFHGRTDIIATAILRDSSGVALIDPGPSSTLESLRAALGQKGIEINEVSQLLLTHIHLDHAGATGTIVERVPGIRVYVHELGAPHMVDPAKLLASATRLWGDEMESLWGAFLPVPPSQVTALAGGERLQLAGRSLQVAYTPGHAKHHVSFLDEQSGMAYVGDTAGIRVAGDHLLAPTPAPDIDVEAWQQSLDRIDAWQPVSLFLAHFGPVTPARAHIARYRPVLTAQAEAVRELMRSGLTEEERIRVFADQLRNEARRHLPEREARATELAAPFEQLWYGLARYWQKKDQTARASESSM